MRAPTDWHLLLDRYLAGECTPKEAMAVRRRLAESAELRAMVDALMAARERAAERNTALPRSTVGPDAVQAARARLEQRLAAPAKRRGPVINPRAWAIAATILIATAGALVAARTVWFAPSQPMQTFASGPGHRTTVVLRDGTRLLLAPGAVVRVPRNFSQSDRTVELDGEALFSVVHDERHPFTVHAAGIVARDIGTQFDLTSYPDAHVARVAVLDGAVAVHATHEWWRSSTVLHRGMVAGLDHFGHLNRIPDANLAALTSWTTGELEFDGAPLSEVASALERWYGVSIRLAPVLAPRHVTARVRPDALRGVLEALARPLGATVDSTGGAWTITLDGFTP